MSRQIFAQGGLNRPRRVLNRRKRLLNRLFVGRKNTQTDRGILGVRRDIDLGNTDQAGNARIAEPFGNRTTDRIPNRTSKFLLPSGSYRSSLPLSCSLVL